MKARELLKELQNLKEDLLEKDIIIIAPNGLEFDPKIKFKLIDKYDPLNISSENIELLVISHE